MLQKLGCLVLSVYECETANPAELENVQKSLLEDSHYAAAPYVSDHLKSSFFELMAAGTTSSAPKAHVIRPIITVIGIRKVFRPGGV